MSQQQSVKHESVGSAYIVAIILAGLSVTAHSLFVTFRRPPGPEWFVLAALTLLSGSFTVKIPTLSARLSVSETFVFTSALLFGTAAGTLTVALDALVISFWLKASARHVARVLFNVAAPAIAMWVSSEWFFVLSGAEPGRIEIRSLQNLIGPLFVFALLYFLINTSLVAGALATERNTSPFEIWVRNFTGLSINYFVGASIAVLIVAYTPRVDLSVLGIIVPLLLISYITFRTSMGRLEDANRHVTQLNELYLSTIETLAMAVDAKDQITHGHIRRVQVYATELARRLGMTDERQLKAIEAAALLHDMGKLAIPEHILNKPGQLTAGELEKMKRHADVGADLLSSIPFPYPVVPIVRHHHENWDGTGYPNGVAGTDIPLGARILAVVDCFDALTSDRPYRPRLSNEAAFEILTKRRGVMYDPLVVDVFLQSHNAIAPAALAAGQQARTLLTGNLGSASEPVTALQHIHVEATVGAALIELRRVLASVQSNIDLVEVVSQFARQATPTSVVALYVYVPQRDVVRCVHAAGDAEGLLRGLEFQTGQRTTGWSAANKRTSVNSSAALDLPYLSDRFTPPLKSALSVPIISGEVLRGVLTFYSNLEDPYDHAHQYFCEQIAAIVADHLPVFEVPSALVPFRPSVRSSSVRK